MRVHKDAKPRELVYTPPSATPKTSPPPVNDEASLNKLIEAFRTVIASIPAPVVHVEAPVVSVPKPEVKINAPVYVQPPEVRVPATTVNVPEGKTPVVNIEPAAVTLKTERPQKWKFTFQRNEYGQLETAYAEEWRRERD
jgi:hypothetical protein